MDRATDEIRKALESEENFFEFLKQTAISEGYDEWEANKTNDNHPPIEVIHNYVKGFLNKKDEKEVGDHILHCDACADELFKITCNPGKLFSFVSILKSSYNNLQRLFSGPLRLRIYTAGFGVAVCCILLFVLFQLHSLPHLIDESYQSLSPNISFNSDILKFPWEKSDNTYMGFTPSEQSDPACSAFRSGMSSGRQKLFPEKPDKSDTGKKWSELPEWSSYFRLGQYCFLLRAVCMSESNVPREFWEQQSDITDRLLQEDFSGDKKLPEKLKKIREILNKTNSPGKIQRGIIADTLDGLISHLSP
jgi:hypothetical protein